MRGFEIVKGYEHMDITIPTRSTTFSAGYDLAIVEEMVIKPGEIVFGKTGIKVFMQDDEVFKIYPRSSLAIRYHLTLANNVGIIDKDYFSNEKNDGHILISLYNFGKEEVHLNKGERVAQGIFEKYLTSPLESSQKTVRNGGHGSTGI
jgi:dUTP pyrophosphatase